VSDFTRIASGFAAASGRADGDEAISSSSLRASPVKCESKAARKRWQLVRVELHPDRYVTRGDLP
jgi:hypothetical protein